MSRVHLVPEQRPRGDVGVHLRDRSRRGDDACPEALGQQPGGEPVIAVAVGDEDVGEVAALRGDPVAEHTRLVGRHRGVGQHRVLAAVDQRARLGREPLRLAVRQDAVLRRRLVDEDVVGEAPGRVVRDLRRGVAAAHVGLHRAVGHHACAPARASRPRRPWSMPRIRRVPGVPRNLCAPMAAERLPAFRGRSSERALLDRLLEDVRARAERRVRRPWRGRHRQDGAAAIRRSSGRPAFASHRSRASSRRWSWPTPGCTSCARRCSTRLDVLPEPQQVALEVALGSSIRRSSRPLPRRLGRARPAVRRRRGAAAAVRRGRLPMARRRLGPVLGFVARRLLAEPVALVFAVREPSDERELAGLPELALRGPRRARRARAARDGHPGPDRRARPRPDRRRDARQSARPAGAAARA